VYHECLINMSSKEVIVAILTTWAFGLGRLGGQLRHALHSFDVVFLLGGGEGRPNVSQKIHW